MTEATVEPTDEVTERDLKAIVEMYISYMVPAGTFVVNADGNKVEVYAVNLNLSKCLEGCCNDVVLRVIDVDRLIAKEWSMIEKDADKRADVEEWVNANNFLSFFAISENVKTHITRTINTTLADLADFTNKPIINEGEVVYNAGDNAKRYAEEQQEMGSSLQDIIAQLIGSGDIQVMDVSDSDDMDASTHDED